MPAAIAFLHTSPVHVPTFTRLLAEVAPGVQGVHVVDESLLQDARRLGADDAGVVRRVREAVVAASASAAVVVCTCSTVGGAAEATPTDGRFVASRIDRAMADRAAELGPAILAVAALQSTLAPTAALIEDSAARLGLAARVAMLAMPEAWAHFEAGDLPAYHAAIAQRVRQALAGPDRPTVVVLAQASMAGAAELLAEVGVPVLSSPRLGVEAAVQALARTPAAD